MCGKSCRAETLSWGAGVGGQKLGQTFAAVARHPCSARNTGPEINKIHHFVPCFFPYQLQQEGLKSPWLFKNKKFISCLTCELKDSLTHAASCRKALRLVKINSVNTVPQATS